MQSPSEIPAPIEEAAGVGSDAKILTERGLRRRAEIMDAAVDAFASDGFQATSVAAIVRTLGVGKGVFYWYFSSKEELFEEILRDVLFGLRRAQAEAIVSGSDPLERISLGIDASLRYFHENRRFFALLEQAWTIEEYAAPLRAGQEVAVHDTARHVREGIVAGQIREADPHFLASAIFGVTTHLARTLLQDGADVDGLITEAIAFCLGGIRKT